MRLEQESNSTLQEASRICVRRRREREAVKKPLDVWRRRESGRQAAKRESERKVLKKVGQVVDVKLLPMDESNGLGRVNVPVSMAVARPVEDGVEVEVEKPLRVVVGLLILVEVEGSSNCRAARCINCGSGGGSLRSKRRSLGRRSSLVA
jgi:hypothetical protein